MYIFYLAANIVRIFKNSSQTPLLFIREAALIEGTYPYFDENG